MQRSCATSGTSLRVPTVAPVGVAVEVWFSTAYQLPYWYMVFGILQPTTVTGMAYSFALVPGESGSWRFVDFCSKLLP